MLGSGFFMSVSSGALHINRNEIGLKSTGKRGIALVEDAAGSEAVSTEVGRLAGGKESWAWHPAPLRRSLGVDSYLWHSDLSP